MDPEKQSEKSTPFLLMSTLHIFQVTSTYLDLAGHCIEGKSFGLAATSVGGLSPLWYPWHDEARCLLAAAKGGGLASICDAAEELCLGCPGL